MKITISIECFDDEEALSHLSDIRRKLKYFLNKSDENSEEVKTIVHNNCDGYSETTIDLSI